MQTTMGLSLRKSRIMLFFIMILIIGVLPYRTTKASSVDQTAKKTFVVGFDAEFPPYGYKDDNGEYIGFDLDLADEVCKRNGWTLKKQPIDWDSKDLELKSGMIDCIWNGFTMNGRENLYTWSVPYVDNSQVVIVKKDSNINKLTDLAGKIVGVQADSSALAALSGDDASKENLELARSFDTLQQIPDYNSAFMNLEIGAIDAICMDIGVAQYEIAARGDEYIMLDEQVSTEQYGIGFKLGNTELRDQVQETLFSMLDDGTFAKIAKNWGLAGCVCLQNEKSGETVDIPVVSDDANESEEDFTKMPVKKQKRDFAWTMNVMKQLCSGMKDTIIIFVLTLLFSLPLGLVIAWGRMSKWGIFRGITKFYISLLRGTPLMLQLIAIFYGPSIIFDWTQPKNYRFYAVIIGFALNYAAYFAEIYRSGIQGVPVGQYEAAEVLGYTKTQTFWKIIFPQMCRRIIPPVTNEVITLVKDTSLAFVLTYAEMFTIAKQIVSKQATILPLFIAGLFYYIFNVIVAFVMEQLEKKLSYY